MKDEQEELREKSIRGFLSKFDMEGFIAQKGLRNLARENALQDRGALPKEDGDVVREYKALKKMS